MTGKRQEDRQRRRKTVRGGNESAIVGKVKMRMTGRKRGKENKNKQTGRKQSER